MDAGTRSSIVGLNILDKSDMLHNRIRQKLTKRFSSQGFDNTPTSPDLGMRKSRSRNLLDLISHSHSNLQSLGGIHMRRKWKTMYIRFCFFYRLIQFKEQLELHLVEYDHDPTAILSETHRMFRVFIPQADTVLTKRGKIIVKAGHKAGFAYMILSGQVEVFIIRNAVKIWLNTLKAGDSFGERSFRSSSDATDIS
eukprot:jgi/Hompol1/3335/HPOL_006481-RA